MWKLPWRKPWIKAAFLSQCLVTGWSYSLVATGCKK